MTGQAQLPGGGKPSRATADDGHGLAAVDLRAGGFGFQGQATQFLHGDRVIEKLAGTGIHAQVGTDLAANAGRKGRIVQDQFQGFLDFALAQQFDAFLGRDGRRAGSLAGGAILFVLPMGDFEAVVAAVDQAGDMQVVVLDHIAEDAAFHPFLLAELPHGDAVVYLSLFIGFGDNLAPGGKVRQGFKPMEAVDFFEKDRQAGF